MKEFTLEEVAKFNGKKGQRAYVVYAGKVYDITDSDFWDGGEHMGAHEAGTDLTESLNNDAPHGNEALDNYEQVGVLKK